MNPLLRIFLWVQAVSLALVLTGCSPVLFDSSLTNDQGIYSNQPPDVIQNIQKNLVVVPVRYHGMDGRIHQGQVVIHKALENDIRTIFDVIKRKRFPVESVLPIAHPVIQKKGPYGLSSDTNNTSGYVWRPIVNSRKLSMHALGLAIDINPRLNPYIKGDLVLPAGSTYDPSTPGTFAADSPIVRAFKKLGWEWGGDWTQGAIDYMHFQKIPPNLKDWVKEHRKR
jgi:hypothetical protein